MQPVFRICICGRVRVRFHGKVVALNLVPSFALTNETRQRRKPPQRRHRAFDIESVDNIKSVATRTSHTTIARLYTRVRSCFHANQSRKSQPTPYLYLVMDCNRYQSKKNTNASVFGVFDENAGELRYGRGTATSSRYGHYERQSWS